MLGKQDHRSSNAHSGSTELQHGDQAE